jgi:hypothetical protein
MQCVSINHERIREGFKAFSKIYNLREFVYRKEIHDFLVTEVSLIQKSHNSKASIRNELKILYKNLSEFGYYDVFKNLISMWTLFESRKDKLTLTRLGIVIGSRFMDLLDFIWLESKSDLIRFLLSLGIRALREKKFKDLDMLAALQNIDLDLVLDRIDMLEAINDKDITLADGCYYELPEDYIKKTTKQRTYNKPRAL